MEADPALAAEFTQVAEALAKTLDQSDFTRMLSGPYDRLGALLTVKPGAGGTESQDWAQMLLRMYTRWAERRGFDVTLQDLQPGDEAGIKSATLKIDGEWAYGILALGKGGAPPGPHLALRLPGPAPHQFRLGRVAAPAEPTRWRLSSTTRT